MVMQVDGSIKNGFTLDGCLRNELYEQSDPMKHITKVTHR